MNSHVENRLNWIAENTGIPRQHIDAIAQQVEGDNAAKPSDLPHSYHKLSPRAKWAFHQMRKEKQDHARTK